MKGLVQGCHGHNNRWQYKFFNVKYIKIKKKLGNCFGFKFFLNENEETLFRDALSFLG